MEQEVRQKPWIGKSSVFGEQRHEAQSEQTPQDGQPRERYACLLMEGGGQDRENRIRRLAEACYRFSPQIALRGSEAVFLEVGRSRRLYDEPSLRLRFQVLARRFDCRLQVAFADEVATALSLARYGCRSREELPLKAIYEYASPFAHDAEVASRMQQTIRQLERLGLRGLEDFRNLPPDSLSSRFGKEAAHVSVFLREASKLAWPRFEPEQSIVEEADLCDAETRSSCFNLESMTFPMKRLLDRAISRLNARGERVLALNLQLKLEDRTLRSWDLRFSAPQGSTHALLSIIRDRLSFDLGSRMLAEPVVEMRLEVSESVPGQGTQRDFFCRREEQQESWDALFDRLCQKLGPDHVFVATLADRHLPERSWRVAEPGLARTSVSAARATPESVSFYECAHQYSFIAPARPARILKMPEEIRQEGHFLIRGTGGSRKTWKVLHWDGPERISGEWWAPETPGGFTRDYYRVVMEGGEHWWVYADGRFLYLHGFFD